MPGSFGAATQKKRMLSCSLPNHLAFEILLVQVGSLSFSLPSFGVSVLFIYLFILRLACPFYLFIYWRGLVHTPAHQRILLTATSHDTGHGHGTGAHWHLTRYSTGKFYNEAPSTVSALPGHSRL